MIALLVKSDECDSEDRPLGDFSGRTRKSEQRAFITGKRAIMVATKGFGMGIDKPNIRLVIHRTPPSNLEAYAQEAGRAGRDGEQASVVLCYSKDNPTSGMNEQPMIDNSDYGIQTFFLTNKYIREEDVRVMRAFLRGVQRKVQDYYYFTSGEVLDFFNQCRNDPSLAGLSAPYAWEDLPIRRFGFRESEEQRRRLNLEHQIETQTKYIKRILDVIYRVRPNVEDIGERITLLAEYHECKNRLRSSRLKNYDAILQSNSYFGALLRDSHMTEHEFKDYLNGDISQACRAAKAVPRGHYAALGRHKTSRTSV